MHLQLHGTIKTGRFSLTFAALAVELLLFLLRADVVCVFSFLHLQLENENRRLKRHLEELVQNFQNQELANGPLRVELERCKRELLGEREKVQMFEAQMKMYSEDFRFERRDRERAQERIDELERKLSATNQQVGSRSCLSDRYIHRCQKRGYNTKRCIAWSAREYVYIHITCSDL